MRCIRLGPCALALLITACGSADSSGSTAAQTAQPAAHEPSSTSPLPVLSLPPPWDAHATRVDGPTFYAVSAHSPEVSVVVQGTNVLHHPGDGRPQLPREHEVRGRPALVTVDEGIRSVTWEEDGAFYVLDVECAHPFSDVRCTEESFALALASSLVEVGP